MTKRAERAIIAVLCIVLVVSVSAWLAGCDSRPQPMGEEIWRAI